MPLADNLWDRLKSAFVETNAARAGGEPALRVRLVGGVPHPGATYTVFKDTSSGSTVYYAVDKTGLRVATGTDVASTTSGLKAVLDAIKASGVHIHFSGNTTFSFLDDVTGQLNATFTDLDDLTFSGEGMFTTIVRSYSTNSSGSDTEPLSFTRCCRVNIRDLQLRSEGTARQTSDALDFDNGNECVVERVYVSAARGNGIHFDGKDYAYAVSGAAYANSVATVTCASHALRVGMWAKVSGIVSASSTAGFNGFHKITARTSTTISYALPADPGAYVSGGTVSGASTKNVVRDCVTTGCASDGIELLAADDNEVVNCRSYGNTGHGLQITKASSGADSANRKSTGNRVIGGAYTDNGADGINVASSDRNTVIGALCRDNARVTASKDGIRVETANSQTADYNVFANCICTDGKGAGAGGLRQRYGINISPASATDANKNVVTGCQLLGNLTGALNDGGTDTVDASNVKA
jgi:hypothetical protein